MSPTTPPPVVSLTYQILPPPNIPSSNQTTSAHITYTIPTNPTEGTTTYYSALSSTLLKVQADLNEVLTGWKDVIGDKEKEKEDTGKVGFGQGRASRMTGSTSDFVDVEVEDSSEEEG